MEMLISPVAEAVVKGILSEVNSFIRNKYHEVYGVESKIENLKSKLSAIEATLRHGEMLHQGCVSEPLRDWLTKLQDVALDVEDVVSTYATEAASWSYQYHNKLHAPLAWALLKAKASSKIKALVKKIDAISKEKEDFHLRVGADVNPRTRATRTGLREERFLRNTSEIIGRVREKEEIVQWLVSNEPNRVEVEREVPVLAIVGMGGLGKTTLAQQVFNDPRIYKKDETGHFEVAMWVNASASEDFSVDRIFKEMLEFITEVKHDATPQGLIQGLIHKVLREKRFLLVLDDVWPDKLDWEPLRGFLNLELCPGSKLLVTSRNENVSKKMGAVEILKLGDMTEEECWELFSKRVFRPGECTPELEEIGRKIIVKCKFLPLAVKAMAGILQGNGDKLRWEKILKDGVWESDQSLFRNDTSDIPPALLLSYDDLPLQLRQCFAYCFMFPKGYMFDQNEMVKLWIAQNYIQPCGHDEDNIEELGSSYFEELQARSFFQPLDVNSDRNELIKVWIAEDRIHGVEEVVNHHYEDLLKTSKELAMYTVRYKMHDLIHDMARHVSRSCQQIEESGSQPIESGLRHLSFLGKDVGKFAKRILQGKPHKLRTLLLPTPYTKDFNPEQTLDKVFRAISYLRVLDLSSTTITYLPESIGELKLLGLLNLSRTEIKKLPNKLCSLYNLQILKLLQCVWLWELPKDLGNLKNLKHLELDEMFWYKCSALPRKIGGLTGLHNLHAFPICRKSGYGIEELKCMNSLKGVLRISNLENSENAHSAELKQKEKITRLILEWSTEAEDTQERAAQERVLEDLEPHHGLKELQINRFKGNEFPNWIGILSNLEKVSLKHCINCRVLSLGELPKLRELSIKGLLELAAWPNETYSSLQMLTISNCPQLKELPSMFENLCVAKIKRCDALTALPVMPSLAFLRLINNELLEDWSERLVQLVTRNDTGRDVPTIKVSSFMGLLELKIVDCPRLQTLPQVFSPQRLELSGCTSLNTLPCPHLCQRLQFLEVDNCIGPSLIEAMPSTSSLLSLVISNVRYMYALPELPHLPGLEALYIHNCPDLMSLSYTYGLLERLPFLNYLFISGCRKLLTFPGKDLPSSIQCLSIKDCSELRSLRPGNCLAKITSLRDLCLEDCPKLGLLPEDGLPSNLQHLSIRGCPLLAHKCREDKGDRYWPMINHVADVEIDLGTPEPQAPLRSKKHHCGCFRA